MGGHNQIEPKKIISSIWYFFWKKLNIPGQNKIEYYGLVFCLKFQIKKSN